MKLKFLQRIGMVRHPLDSFPVRHCAPAFVLFHGFNANGCFGSRSEWYKFCWTLAPFRFDNLEIRILALVLLTLPLYRFNCSLDFQGLREIKDVSLWLLFSAEIENWEENELIWYWLPTLAGIFSYIGIWGKQTSTRNFLSTYSNYLTGRVPVFWYLTLTNHYSYLFFAFGSQFVKMFKCRLLEVMFFRVGYRFHNI